MPRRKRDDDDNGYNRDNGNNDRIIRHQRKARAAIQDVAEEYGDLLRDGPVDEKRRARCKDDLGLYCVTYFPQTFTKKFSKAHLRAFELIQRAIIERDRFALAMMRGGGKSTICLAAVQWGASYGISRYSVLVNAVNTMSQDRIESIKMDWLTNELLLEDFPEIACPILHMGGEQRRCSGQHYMNEPTRISWEKNRIVFPTIDVPYAKQQGAIIESSGILGNLRGKNRKNRKGETLRPDLVLVDDPQTDESASSPTLTRKRIKVLTKTIEFLGGTTRATGVVMPCTIIEKGDLADQFLDRKLHPEWHGERTRMLESFPKTLDLWHKYHEIFQECNANDLPIEPATKFYRSNRKKMEEGCVCSWPEGYDDSKASSAIEYAMQLYLKNPSSFAAEFQNDPQEEEGTDSFSLKSEQLQMSGVARGKLPHGTTHLIAHIDCQKPVLFWTVTAFREGFNADIVDYGPWPHQGVRHVTLSTLKKTLKQHYPSHGDEAALLKGLQELIEFLCTRDFSADIGSNQVQRIVQLGVDENYQTKIVHNAIRTSPHRGLVLPYRGIGVTAAMQPLNHPSKAKKDGEVIGDYWRIVPNKGGLRTMQADVNHWKTFTASRLTTPRGDSGSICIPTEKPRHNDMLLEQLTSEESQEIRNETWGRTVQQWKEKKAGRDNHFWDCLVGSCVSASYRGIKLGGIPDFVIKKSKKPRRRVIQ